MQTKPFEEPSFSFEDDFDNPNYMPSFLSLSDEPSIWSQHFQQKDSQQFNPPYNCPLNDLFINEACFGPTRLFLTPIMYPTTPNPAASVWEKLNHFCPECRKREVVKICFACHRKVCNECVWENHFSCRPMPQRIVDIPKKAKEKAASLKEWVKKVQDIETGEMFKRKEAELNQIVEKEMKKCVEILEKKKREAQETIRSHIEKIKLEKISKLILKQSRLILCKKKAERILNTVDLNKVDHRNTTMQELFAICTDEPNKDVGTIENHLRGLNVKFDLRDFDALEKCFMAKVFDEREEAVLRSDSFSNERQSDKVTQAKLTKSSPGKQNKDFLWPDSPNHRNSSKETKSMNSSSTSNSLQEGINLNQPPHNKNTSTSNDPIINIENESDNENDEEMSQRSLSNINGNIVEWKDVPDKRTKKGQERYLFEEISKSLKENFCSLTLLTKNNPKFRLITTKTSKGSCHQFSDLKAMNLLRIFQKEEYSNISNLITEVDMSLVRLKASGLEAFGQVLVKFPALSKIHLHFLKSEEMFPAEIVAFEKKLQCLPKLIQLELSIPRWKNLMNGFIGEVFKEVAMLKGLKSFTMNLAECFNVNNYGVKNATDYLPQMKGLKRLCIYFKRCVKLNNERLDDIAENLIAMEHLESLFLSFEGCPNITNKGYQELTKVLKSKPSLKFEIQKD